MDSLIRKSMSSRRRELPGDCPDENAFAAYFEHRLSQKEIASFESHAAECDSCQNVLALGMKLGDPEAAARESAGSERTKAHFHISIPIRAFGGAAAVIILIAIGIRLFHNPAVKPAPTQTVALKEPAVAVEPAVMKAPLPAPTASVNRSNTRRIKTRPSAHIEQEIADLPHKGIALSSSIVPPALPAVKPDEPAPRDSDVVESAMMKSLALPVPAAPGSLGGKEGSLASGKTVSLPPLSPPMNAGVGGMDGYTSGLGGRSGFGGGFGGFGMGSSGGGGMMGGGMMGSGPAANRSRVNVPAPKKIGDKEFYFNSGWWVDRQARYQPGDPFIEITSTDPEYENILEQYKELSNLRPVLLNWKNKIYVLR
jgi:hypothetical protein